MGNQDFHTIEDLDSKRNVYLRFYDNIEHGTRNVTLQKGDVVLTSDYMEELGTIMAMLIEFLRSDPPANAKIAVLGMGFGIQPAFLEAMNFPCDVYEIEPSIIKRAIDYWSPYYSGRWTCVEGDAGTTLKDHEGKYDFILADLTWSGTELTGFPPEMRPVIEKALKPGGKIIEFGKWNRDIIAVRPANAKLDETLAISEKIRTGEIYGQRNK